MFENPFGLVNRWAAVMIATWLDRLQHALLPPTCLLCGVAGTAGRDLCAGCAAALPWNTAACPRFSVQLSSVRTEPCDRFRSHPRDFDRAYVPFHYRPPVDFLIRRLKFDGRLSHARLLGELLATALAERGDPPPDCIVPVPLHPLRIRERGFNQALLLARHSAEGQAWQSAAVAAMRPIVQQRIDRLAQALGNREWLEERFTIGDLAIADVLRAAPDPALLAAHPNLTAYVARATARPAFQAAMAAQLADFDPDPA